MKTAKVALVLTAIAVVGGALALTGHLPGQERLKGLFASGGARTEPSKAQPAPPLAVSVVRATPRAFTETVLVTGTLVAREEILIGPEVEGLRVVEVLVDEGDRVVKGQTLARLVSETLEAQLAQNTAALARADAAIAQARSAIASAEARLEEASNAYDRAKPLSKSGFLSDSGMDQREATQRTASAALTSARDGLKVAEADRAQTAALRRELEWRRERTEIRAVADGLVSRRNAKIGSYATGAADAMFRIVAKGEIELDAEVAEVQIGKLRQGQTAAIEIAGAGTVSGVVRLVSSEIDRATRLGRVRIFIGDLPQLRVGAFARARVTTGESQGLAVPTAAVLYGADGPYLQVVTDGKVATRPIKLGLQEGSSIEVRSGIAEGDAIVARSGTFLRDGDVVTPVPVAARQVSEVR
jgi:RND family efflux transporter MFP subunit